MVIRNLTYATTLGHVAGASSGDGMAQIQSNTASALGRVDPVWARIRHEADEVVRREPELATFIYSTILQHDTLEAAVIRRVTERLDRPEISAKQIRQTYGDALESDSPIASSSRCFISRAFMRSRRIVWPTGCGARAARTSPITCKVSPHRSCRPTSIRRRRSGEASSLITRLAWWSAKRR